MPRKNRKGRSDHRRGEGSVPLSDDESVNDNASVFSNNSENKSTGDEESEDLVQEQFEEKLQDILDGLMQKSSQGRTNCLVNLSKALVSKYIPAFVLDRQFTICDGIERSLKKGGPVEKAAAAELAAIVCVQLGGEEIIQEIYKALKPVLLTTACDNSVTPLVRGKCCSALAMISLLSTIELGDLVAIMQQFEHIFSGSYLKGDGSVPNITADIANLHTLALSAWGLILTAIDPPTAFAMLNTSKAFPSIKQLTGLLESQHLDVRLTAGETLSLIFEFAREEDHELVDELDYILDSLKSLATDSHKYRAKKDRKQQRATFRDILTFLEDDVIPDQQVKFEKEVLVLNSWTRRKLYESFCGILGPGINIHLSENDLIRDILDLPPKIITDNRIPKHAQNQMERFRKRFVCAANYKARTISRAKNRDKKLDF